MSRFRNVTVSGTAGSYQITGEAKTPSGEISYTIEDGHRYLEQSSFQVEKSEDKWISFQLNVFVPREYLPAFGVLTMTLYEVRADNHTEMNKESFTLDELNESEQI